MDKPINSPRRVLACRPKEQNAEWCTFLREKGLEVIDIPLLQIADIETTANKQHIKELILQLDHFDYLIFISQNAVKHAFEWIDDFWPQLPENQTMFAIGKKTAAAIKELCENYYSGCELQLISSDAGMNSEALLSHALLEKVEDKKILILKGAGGRKHLEQVLGSRGAKVECCELYERSLPDEAIEQFSEIEFNKESDIFVVFSGETLNNLESALEGNEYPDKKEIPLLVPGLRVAELAESLGFQSIHVAENASEPQMWQALNTIVIEKQTNSEKE